MGTSLFRLHLYCFHQCSCSSPSLSGLSAFLGTHFPSKGNHHPFRVLPCQLQDKVIKDQANEDDIHQHPGKNYSVSKILFVNGFHSSRAP